MKEEIESKIHNIRNMMINEEEDTEMSKIIGITTTTTLSTDTTTEKGLTEIVQRPVNPTGKPTNRDETSLIPTDENSTETLNKTSTEN